MTIIHGVLAAAVAVEREGANGQIIFFVQMLAIFMILYWVMIRPGQREQRRLRERIAAIKKGDEVVTAGGIVGTIVHVDEDKVTIRSDESRFKLERGRIAHVVTATED